jgi:hypothetical protein
MRFRSSPTWHFLRHYLEMVAAMFLGMAVLDWPAGRLLSALGVESGAPTPMLLSMAVTMTIPMVAWMAFRGHGRRANAEMAASMLVPAAAAVALLEAHALAYSGAVMVVEHVAMLAAMLAAMLLRPAEYTGHGHAQVAA